MKNSPEKDFAGVANKPGFSIGEDRMETPATPVKKAATPVKKKATPKKVAIKATVFTLGESLLTGKTLVKEGAVGAALYRIVEAAPDGKATLQDILDALAVMEKDGNGLGVKSAHYHSPEKRAGYVNGYIRWLVGNDNLKAG